MLQFMRRGKHCKKHSWGCSAITGDGAGDATTRFCGDNKDTLAPSWQNGRLDQLKRWFSIYPSLLAQLSLGSWVGS